MLRAQLGLLIAAVPAAANSCLLVRDAASQQEVKIEAYGANAARVRAVKQGVALRDDLISALVPPADGVVAGESCAVVDLAEQADPPTLSNGNLRVSLGQDGRLSFVRVSDGQLLLHEKMVRAIEPATTTPQLPGFYSLDLQFEAVQGERIYGLGQHKTGKLDNKGVKGLKLNPHNTEILVPVAHSSLGYAFLFNLPSFGTVEYSDESSHWHADVMLQMDIWVGTTVDGPTHQVSPWAQLQSSYADVTGHSPVYPEWASGFWQCRNRYHNQTQVMETALGYVERQYPISLIVIDFFTWSDTAPLGDEVLPKECWPDPKLMVDELKDMGVELMLSPYFHSVTGESKNYPDALAQGFIVQGPDGKPAKVAFGDAYLYDLFQPEARAYAFRAVEEGYIKPYGLHHWWLDCDEPCDAKNMNNLLYNNGTWPAAFVGAAYPHMLDLMVWEGMGAPGKAYEDDNVMLARSAWAGSQRYGGAVWSGDTRSDFNNLNQQFRAGLNMVMSGVPYWTTDIGGYGGGEIDSPEFRELIVRWFQWGAFCPLFRNHGARSGAPFPPDSGGTCGNSPSNEIWNFGPESETAIVRVMRLREQLRPYVMKLFSEAAEKGTPVMRPLFFDFWEDEGAQLVDDEMMFGPDYLVAPQLLENSTSRNVYLPALPKGSVWENVFTRVDTDTSDGGRNITEATPLSGDGFGTLPLYRRKVKFAYPKPPTCDDSCTITPNTDQAAGATLLRKVVNISSDESCCGECKADTGCTAFVRGPDEKAGNVMTCFLLKNDVTQVKHSADRNYGCVRSGVAQFI